MFRFYVLILLAVGGEYNDQIFRLRVIELDIPRDGHDFAALLLWGAGDFEFDLDFAREVLKWNPRGKVALVKPGEVICVQVPDEGEDDESTTEFSRLNGLTLPFEAVVSDLSDIDKDGTLESEEVQISRVLCLDPSKVEIIMSMK